jgi:metal-responsive CopG/Arc/MetJ family transcriptional regulator
MRKKYTNIAVPTELAEEIDKVISKNKLSYTSRAQFTLEAIRQKIKEEMKF